MNSYFVRVFAVTHHKSFDPSGNTTPGILSDRITQEARQKIGAKLVQERITHASVYDVQAWLETVGLQEVRRFITFCRPC